MKFLCLFLKVISLPRKPVLVFWNFGCFLSLSYPPPLWTYFLCLLYLLFFIPLYSSLLFSFLLSFPSSFLSSFSILPFTLLFYPFSPLLSTDISSPTFSSPSLFLSCPLLLPLASLISLRLLLAYGVHLL